MFDATSTESPSVKSVTVASGREPFSSVVSSVVGAVPGVSKPLTSTSTSSPGSKPSASGSAKKRELFGSISSAEINRTTDPSGAEATASVVSTICCANSASVISAGR